MSTSSSFSLKEKNKYYKSKWRKEHISLIIISIIIWIFVVVATMMEKLNIMNIIFIAIILAAFIYVIIYNEMMRYVKEHIKK